MDAAAMSVVYMLTTPIPEDGGDDPTVEQVMKRNKWDNDDYVCRGLILKGKSDLLFDIQQIVESRKELWDSLEAKYMAKDASSKKFFVSNFINYKITNSRPVMEQHNELLGILGRFTQHKMNMDEALQVSCIIDKLPHSWKDFKHTLNHKKEELTLVELGSHLRIEESLRAQDSDKPKGNNVVGPVPNKRNMITPYDLWTKRKPNLNYLRVWGCMAIVRLPNPKLKSLGERGIECIFVGYAKHSKAFRFYVIQPNDSVLINSIIELKDAIFDENGFSLVSRPSLRIPNGTEDIGGSVVPEEATKEVVQQPEPELRKNKRNRTPKDFGTEFQLYLIEGTRDEVSDQHSYCFNVENDPKTFDEAIKWKEAINDEMDSFMGNNTYVLADLPLVARISTIRLLTTMVSIHNLIIHQMDMKTTFFNGDLEEDVYMNQPQASSCLAMKTRKFDKFSKGVIICLYVDDILIFGSDQVQVDLTKEFLSSKFFMKDMGETDVILVSTPIDTSEKLMPNNGQAISNNEDNSSTSGWVFLLGGGVISWASKKQTCITGSTMESEFVALAAAGKEAEWLKKLLFEIPLWSKPIAPISIRCDNAATLAKAYSQMYNGKSRHLGVRHSMIHELITNGVISIEFVRSQQNLADHLMKRYWKLKAKLPKASTLQHKC
ncbi:zinc finger, CCHC-type containing protein [Tanacetum coccineum]